MVDYAIGDLQGCYGPLQRLLEAIHFNDRLDRLWFVGDLVGRGPEPLAILRFIKNLIVTPRITLGNHDLHLIARLFDSKAQAYSDDRLDEILLAPDAQELGHWLRRQSMIYYDVALNVVMCHAGIAPAWDLTTAVALAKELETVLSGENFREFLSLMYGNEPNYWSVKLRGSDRLRVICNYFTRMRFCDGEGHLVLNYKGTIDKAPANLYPWYLAPKRHEIEADIVFGHWAALQGKCTHPRIHALDMGCLWGGSLTALRLEDKQRITVPGL